GLGATTFSTTNLPPLSGSLGWKVNYGTTNVVLSVVQSADFNHDGNIDAADYPNWRQGLGTTFTQADYDNWRANFGSTAGGGTGAALSNGPVPEPAGALLVGVAGILTLLRASRRRRLLYC